MLNVLKVTVFLVVLSLYAQLKIIVRDENLVEHLSFIKVNSKVFRVNENGILYCRFETSLLKVILWCDNSLY